MYKNQNIFSILLTFPIGILYFFSSRNATSKMKRDKLKNGMNKNGIFYPKQRWKTIRFNVLKISNCVSFFKKISFTTFGKRNDESNRHFSFKSMTFFFVYFLWNIYFLICILRFSTFKTIQVFNCRVLYKAVH